MLESTLAARIQLLGADTSQFAQKLEDPTEAFVTLFPNLSKDRIHIVVMPPIASRLVGVHDILLKVNNTDNFPLPIPSQRTS